ncbi:Glycosyl transferase family 1 [Candidatus Nitrotoga fabula]|uniref:Glycosyl transferase family 1 n=2 Tax=Candidatus Nitrotoga fabula TaxID=2182327 RepID=A0A916BCX0_9PROT|nr:Glycosyl transferase family 1 [Candidatus Nitrotoga fabula]
MLDADSHGVGNLMRGIKLVSWSGTSGYALSALNYLRGLVAQQIPIEWVPLCSGPDGYMPWHTDLGMDALDFFPTLSNDPMHTDLQQLVKHCCRSCNYDTVLVHLPPEYWPLYFEPGRRNIGFTAWETNRLPPHWPSLLNLAERVLVPSNMNREVCEHCGVVVPVRTVPHMQREISPLMLDKRRQQIRTELGIGPHTTVFYSINTWEPRKAVYDLLSAFASAFTDTDDVLLLIKTSPQGIGAPPSFTVEPVADLLAKWHQRSTRGRKTCLPPIRVIGDNLSGEKIEHLHRAGDVFVSLTHGEGWGMGGCEALAHGRPVLMTGWGGQLDYLGNDWPWLVKYRLIQLTPWPQQASFLATQQWAQADLVHAAELMRSLHCDLPAAMTHATQAAGDLRQRLSMKIVTDHLLSSLND